LLRIMGLTAQGIKIPPELGIYYPNEPIKRQ